MWIPLACHPTMTNTCAQLVTIAQQEHGIQFPAQVEHTEMMSELPKYQTVMTVQKDPIANPKG
jgi:hypothetical protein